MPRTPTARRATPSCTHPNPACGQARGASAPVLGPKPWSPSNFQPWLRPCLPMSMNYANLERLVATARRQRQNDTYTLIKSDRHANMLLHLLMSEELKWKIVDFLSEARNIHAKMASREKETY